MAISDQLTLLANTKESIRTSINNKGGSVGASDTFASYATAIDNLPSGGDNSTLIDLIERDITSITIPSGTTKIGINAFYELTSLTSVTIPNTVTLIDTNAFYHCINLSSITIPNSVTTISFYSFYHCDNLTDVNLPNSVTTIGNSAFSTCQRLSSVTLGNSVTSIGMSAFNGNPSMTKLVINTVTPPTLGSSGVYGAWPIYVPAASVDTYKTASGWSTYADRIQAIPSE